MSLDAVIESFSEAFGVTKEVDTTFRPHPKYNQFRRDHNLDQQMQLKRRKEFFDQQKKNRSQIVMRFRSLVAEVEDNSSQPMDTSDGPKAVAKRNKYYVNRYKDQLMLSEWLVTIPEDFITQWTLVLCPLGKRCLVVSARGQTKAYSRTGYLMSTFATALPGGNRKIGREGKHHCILDCIYSETKRVYYVLDAIVWNGQQFHDCDTEFRFFWLHSKLETECPEVSERTRLNPYPFIPLKRYGCSESEIISSLKSQDLFPSSELDGLLFYHKQCFYTPGISPLVNWLKPHMISDVLNISIND